MNTLKFITRLFCPHEWEYKEIDTTLGELWGAPWQYYIAKKYCLKCGKEVYIGRGGRRIESGRLSETGRGQEN